MDRHPFSIENILKDTRGASRILKIAPTSEALALAERMAGNDCSLVFSSNEKPLKFTLKRDIQRTNLFRTTV